MISERTFNSNQIKSILNNSYELFIFHEGTDERDGFFLNLLKDQNGQTIVLKLDIEEGTFSINKGPQKDIKSDLTNEISSLLVQGNRNVFIDITSMPVPLIFSCVKSLKELNCNSVLCGYTKPVAYNQKKSQIPIEKFELTKKFIGIRPLPGFLRGYDPDSQKEKLLVLFLGYEGNRATYIFQEVSPGKNSTVPIVGFPGFQPDFHNIAFEMNVQVLNEPYTFEYIEYVTAESPFEAYNCLKLLKEKYNERTLVIAPIGTKVHSLGTALYALEDTECIIIYDNPIESPGRALQVDEGLIFDITCLLK